jgi:hypothetical protein
VCGKEVEVLATSLTRKKRSTESCGCIRVHNMSGHPTYKTWNCMIMRCHNPKRHNYPKYGGRGIEVCKEWRESFQTFLSDMGPRPVGMTLDRIDSNGNYTKENCRWATAKEQSRNRRDNRLAILKGQTMFAPDVARAIGVHEGTVYRWIRENKDVTKKAQDYIDFNFVMARRLPSHT